MNGENIRKPRVLGGGAIELRTDSENWPQWLRDCRTENMEAEVINGRVIVWGGTLHDGIVVDCDWLGGTVREAIWMKGNFMAGRWMNGDWRSGYFGVAIWNDGVFRDGEFHGLWIRGLWLGGKFDGWYEKTGESPEIK